MEASGSWGIDSLPRVKAQGDYLFLGTSNLSCLWAKLPLVAQQEARRHSDVDSVCERTAHTGGQGSKGQGTATSATGTWSRVPSGHQNAYPEAFSTGLGPSH